MQLQLKGSLPFTSVSIEYNDKLLNVDDVLIDTGSASTIFSIDSLSALSIHPEPEDNLFIIRGVGGSEIVFSRIINKITLGDHHLDQFEIEVGGMDYGFEINGILGMDFLTKIATIINLENLSISFG
ncbi:MAG: retropepsin-like domain-containing protein [Anaerolineaceae bacterium]|nr:retropepsin-like domain-containing protein [Anaerolineaceae bacterium]